MRNRVLQSLRIWGTSLAVGWSLLGVSSDTALGQETLHAQSQPAETCPGVHAGVDYTPAADGIVRPQGSQWSQCQPHHGREGASTSLKERRATPEDRERFLRRHPGLRRGLA